MIGSTQCLVGKKGRSYQTLKETIYMGNYKFKRITEELEKEAYGIYKLNEIYFSLTGDKASIEQVQKDRVALPKKVKEDHKKYVLVYFEEQPIGVIDYLMNYPKLGEAYIGLMLIGKKRQGHGQAIYKCLEQSFLQEEVSLVSLAVIKENLPGVYFWKSQGFKEIRTTSTRINMKEIEVIYFEKILSSDMEKQREVFSSQRT